LKDLSGLPQPGLPDGIFAFEKYQFGKYFGRLWNRKYWYVSEPFGISWPFGIFGQLDYWTIGIF
jgi:hypothetical protein